MFLSLRLRQPRGVTRIRTEASSLHPTPRASGPREMGLESTCEPHATRHMCPTPTRTCVPERARVKSGHDAYKLGTL